MDISKRFLEHKYTSDLKKDIEGFLNSFKPRYKKFPWNAVKKIPKSIINSKTPITINGTEFSVKQVLNLIETKKNAISPMLSISGYQHILNAFNKELRDSETEERKKEVLKKYKTEVLPKEFDNLKNDLLFCVSGLKEINKLIKKEVKDLKDTSKEMKESGGLTMNETYIKMIQEGAMFLVSDDVFEEAVKDPKKKTFIDRLKEKIQNFVRNLKAKKYPESRRDLNDLENAIKKLMKDMKENQFDISKQVTTASHICDSVALAISTKEYLNDTNLDMLHDKFANLEDEINKLNKKTKPEDLSKAMQVCHNKLSNLVGELAKEVRRINSFVQKEEAEAKKQEVEEAKNSKDTAMKEAFEENKLSIYRACTEGQITLEEREELLDKLKADMVMEQASDNVNDKMSNIEKFEKIRHILYEKCSAGLISYEQRENLIEEAHEKYLSITEKKEEDLASENEKDPNEPQSIDGKDPIDMDAADPVVPQ